MSSRAQLYLAVVIAAAAAAGLVIGITLDTRTTPRQPQAQAGAPPVPTNLPKPWGPRVEAAYRSWPHGSVDELQKLGLQYPKVAAVQFYRGFALLWAGYPSDAQTALERAKKLGRNTLIQSRADSLLHPEYLLPSSGPGYPVFVPIRPNPLLQRGSTLQGQGHQVSAEHLYQRAARLDPNDDQAQVAAAVGLFDEDNLTPAFSHLGPLTKRFPHSQIVRYYLGFLLVWTAQEDAAVKQFREAVKLGPTTPLGKTSSELLSRIASAGNAAGAKCPGRP
jgi:tetratricopeptide (TPR) repeat protein